MHIFTRKPKTAPIQCKREGNNTAQTAQLAPNLPTKSIKFINEAHGSDYRYTFFVIIFIFLNRFVVLFFFFKKEEKISISRQCESVMKERKKKRLNKLKQNKKRVSYQ